MSAELHLPWGREALKKLLLKIVPLGETDKIDLKSVFQLDSAEQKAELVKDVSAIANTKGVAYDGYGFIVFGADTQKGFCYTDFNDTQDHLKAHIDDQLKANIAPFINTYLFIFHEDTDKKWGVLVIPPSRDLPHVFINRKSDAMRGDIFVRVGTTTERAQPHDYGRFFQYRIEDATYELKEELRALKQDVANLKKTARSLSRKSVKADMVSEKTETMAPNPPDPVMREVLISGADDFTLTELIEDRFQKGVDPIEVRFLKEAQKIKLFLERDEVSWSLNRLPKEQAVDEIKKIENVCFEFWKSLFLITTKDVQGKYTEIIVKAIEILATRPDAPAGTSYTEWGRGVRYIPIFISLYIIFIGGVLKKNANLLKKILNIELRGRTSFDDAYPLPYVLFYARASGDFLQSLHDGYPKTTWLDPCSAYARNLLQRVLVTDDPFWDFDRAFFQGEFLLCLSPLDFEKLNHFSSIYPSEGAYIHYHAAIPAIKTLLKKDRIFVELVFNKPLKEILKSFDEIGPKLGNRFGIPDGFQEGAVKLAYPDTDENSK